MSLTTLSLDTKTETFPFLSGLSKNGSIVPNLDQEQITPTPIYLENIVPTNDGITSVGFVTYTEVFGSTDPSYETLKNADIFPVYAENGNTGYVLVDITNLKVFVYGPQVGITDTLDIISAEFTPNIFFYRDRTYVFHKDFGLRYLDNEFKLVEEPLQGLTIGNLSGMTSSISYLIAWDTDTVYWSDPIDFTQFDPTLTTSNAGATSVLGVRGKINLVLSAPKGFIIYTAGNATRAKFTQNVRNPWIFDELKNSSGVANASQVTDYENLGIHFIWSSAGFGVVGDGNVEYPFSDLTELLAGDVIEDIMFDNETARTLEIIQEEVSQQRFRVEVNFAANRYVAISYGEFESVFSHVLLYDIHLQRWGRIKIDHVDVFNFIPPKKDTLVAAEDLQDDTLHASTEYFGAGANDFLPRDFDFNFWGKDFAILKQNGDVVRVTTNFKSDPHIEDAGILIYGQLALTRRRYSELSEVEINGLIDYEEDKLSVFARAKDTTGNVFRKMHLDPERKRFMIRNVGRNHQVLIRGRFNITTITTSLIQQGMM